MADSAGYDPRRSRVSDDKMNEFLRGQLTGDLLEVPGIGPAAVKKLALGDMDGDKVTNTFQLIGKVSWVGGGGGGGGVHTVYWLKVWIQFAWYFDMNMKWSNKTLPYTNRPSIWQFLMFKGPDDGDAKVTTREHMEKVWYWLQEKGISSHRSGIVRCIAEKMNAMMPGIYDASEYNDEDDSDDDDA